MFITEVSDNGTERTWRRPLTTRIVLVFLLGPGIVLLGLWLALTLVGNQVPSGGWIACALAGAVWGLLAWRVATRFVTLTPDTLVIRGIFETERVPIAGITEVGFRNARLTVTYRHGTGASQRLAVGAVNLGSSRWSGLRSDADSIAEAITEAAGLPPLPPRRQIIGRNRAWVVLLAAAVMFALGVYLGPVASMRTEPSLPRNIAGGLLYATGVSALGLAVRITRDHRRKRTERAAGSDLRQS